MITISLEIINITRIISLTFFGIYISWKDFRKGEIYNKDLLLMGPIGIIIYLASSNLKFISNYVLNFIIALITGIVLWKLDIWGAGDGKLFTVLSLYFPFIFYDNPFVSQTFLFNFLILAFLIWLPSLIFKTKKQEKFDAFKKIFVMKNILNLSLLTFGPFWVLGILMSLLRVNVYIFSILIALIFFYVLDRTFQKNVRYIMVGVCVIRLFLDSTIYRFTFLVDYGLTLIVMSVAYALGLLAMKFSYELRSLENMKEGDIPIGIIRKTSKDDVNIENLLKEFFKEEKDRIMSSGFKEEDLKKVKNMKSEIDGFLVKKYVVFAPMYFVALLVTMLIKQDIIMYSFGIIYR